MFALLEIREVPPSRGLERVRRRFFPERNFYGAREQILGLNMLRLRLDRHPGIDGKVLTGILSRITARLRAEGALDFCLSRNFPREGLPHGGPFREMDSRYLYECMAGEIAAFAAEGGGRTAAFFCHSVGEREQTALWHMCAAYRHIILVTDRDAGLVCRNMRRRFGVAVMGDPTERQVQEADFAVFFQKPRIPVRLKASCAVFAPDPGAIAEVKTGRRVTAVRFSLPAAVESQLPLGFEPSPIVSAAVKYGTCDIRKIGIMGLRLDKA